MINNQAKLAKELFLKKISLKASRDGYGEGLVEAGEQNKNVVVLTADLKDSTRASYFAAKFPERFIDVGVAEQTLASVAAGLAAGGKIPFISSYAIFSPGRNWEQIRTTVCLNNLPVKIAGSHAGFSAGRDGSSHQMMEDIALMRTLPKMTVVVPCDALETKKATLAAAKSPGAVYLRFQKDEAPVVTSEKTAFKIGQAETYWQDKDPQVAIVACGRLVYESLLAARELAKMGIGSVVLNCHTVKPLDQRAVIHAAKIAGAVVTAEEHQISGGLGSAVAEVLAKNFPVPVEFIGLQDVFGESGSAEELAEKYGLQAKNIIFMAKRVVARKNN